MASKRYATVKEAADLLGVSLHTVRHYEARGVLPRAMRSPVNHYRLWDRQELVEACRRLAPVQPREAVSA